MNPRVEALVRKSIIGATVALLIGVVVSIGALVSPRVRGALGLVPPPAYAKGSTVDVPSELYSQSPRTLILFARSTCSACQNAKPIFTNVFRELRMRSPDIKFRLVTTGDGLARSEQEFASELGLDAQSIYGAPRGSIRLDVVPTLILVDVSGRILYSLTGALEPEREAVVVENLLRQ